MTLRGVLFDVDGTLVDTTYLHAVTWSETLSQLGRPVATARAHRAVGAGTAELLDTLLGAGRPEGFDEQADTVHHALYEQHYGHLRPLPGARELLRWCHARSLRIVLASSASEGELAALTDTLGLDEEIHAATSSGDAAAAKPHPDILHSALAAGELEPADALLVGDAVWDGMAAERAGLRFVALTCGGTSESELREAGALEVWADPADLLEHVEQSVLSR